MHARLSKMCLMVYVGLLVLSGFLLSVPGDYWPWYAIMALVASVPAAVGRRWHRLLGVAALALAGILIIGDIRAGKVHREKFRRFSTQQTEAHPTEGRAIESSEPPPPPR